MFKFLACVQKDIKLLLRDWVGMSLMFGMPILLVIVITSLQAGTFRMLNGKKISVLWSSSDNGNVSKELKNTLNHIGMFDLAEIPPGLSVTQINEELESHNALLVLVVPSGFSELVIKKADKITNNTLIDLGFSEQKKDNSPDPVNSLTFYYSPVLQDSYRQSIRGALRSAIQIIENKQVLQSIYFSLNQKNLPDSLESIFMKNQILINEIPVSKNGNKSIPNASQHNIPAWTIFAMFFIVASLGSSVVKEKISGSSLRLKTLPTNYLLAIVSKQLVYLVVCMLQVIVIFSIGVWLFPHIGLPKLNMPSDFTALIIISLVCGWCAVSYAIAVGVFSQTQEQANGFGAISIVILAALGGILIPSFAMPDSFHIFLKISPLHWCLESYYGLFLEGGKFKDILNNLLPLIGIIVFLQFIAFAGLKKKNFI